MTILEAMHDPKLFRPWFSGNSWDAWRAFLCVIFALPMTADQWRIYRRQTGRDRKPKQPFREAWLVVGRRGGKSLIASLVAVYLAAFKDFSQYLKPGEVGTIAVIAADRKQARTIMRYVKGFLQVPMLRQLVTNETADAMELSGNVVIEVHTASFRSVRGYTLLAVICDEVAFWRSEDSANPDKEILAAVRPELATIPESLLLCISSPYARRGALWEAHRRHYGKESPVLVWQAATRYMNSMLPQSVIDQALEEDEASARAEYLAEFRKDTETFIDREAIEAIVIEGRLEWEPQPDARYFSFVDPSGGSSDSFTLAIAHRKGDTTILDLVRERKPPFNPASVVQEFASDLRRYNISYVMGDAYAGEWPREQLRKHGLRYEVAGKTRSQLYLSLLPMINSGQLELLDHSRLVNQLISLERRTSRAGKDTIDHPPNAHDDVANAAAGALVFAGRVKREIIWGPVAMDETDHQIDKRLEEIRKGRGQKHTSGSEERFKSAL